MPKLLNLFLSIHKHFNKQAELIFTFPQHIIFYFLCIFNYFLTFHYETYKAVGSQTSFQQGHGVCPPYWQNCNLWLTLDILPGNLSYYWLMMTLFVLIIGAGTFPFIKRFRSFSLYCLFCIIIYKIGMSFLFDFSSIKNFDYFFVPISILLLFSKNPTRSASFVFIFIYFSASSEKFEASWLAGTYFTSTLYGLPFVKSINITILLTNIVTIMELAGVWFLLSKNRLLRFSVLGFFLFFHVFSIPMVGLRYPIQTVPFLLLFFIYNEWGFNIKLCRTAKALVSVLFTLQIFPAFIQGDETLTLEGYKFGVSMFDANHQCSSNITVNYKNDKTHSILKNTRSAMNRCWIYSKYWKIKKKLCSKPEVSKISWMFDHSRNGEPFLRIINVENICNKPYLAWNHNQWIQLEDEAQIVGYPYPNFYYRNDPLNLKEIVSQEKQIHFSDLQKFIIANESFFSKLLWSIWILIASLIFIRYLFL